MDISAITAAISAIRSAHDICKGILAIRDEAILKTEIGKMNDQLFKAQESLASVSTQLLVVQQQLFETSDKLRKAEETIAERGSYTLIQSGVGHWVYRVNILPEQSGATQPGTPQVPHYVCQPCFDGGRKVVLKLHYTRGVGHYFLCPVCKTSFHANLIY